MTTYGRVLRDGRLSALIGCDVLAKVGDGISFVALPLLALQVRGDVPPALAISAAMAAPFVLSISGALFFGLSRRRYHPRLVIGLDGILRGAAFVGVGVLAFAGALTLWSLIAVLFAGSALRLLSMSGRRLVATGMAGPEARLAVNGLLGISDSLALYVAGPAVGGVLAAAAGPGVALVVVGACVLTLLAAAAVSRTAPAEPEPRAGDARSGWSILRRNAVALRLLVVVFLFDLFYGPVEVALPLLVTGDLHADARALGTLWTCFGVGALFGAALTSRLGRFRPKTTVVAIIGGWAATLAVLAVASSTGVAGAAFALGGVIYGPFGAIAYTFLQENLAEPEQQPVISLYSAGITLAAPLGLGTAGPLIAVLGARGGLLCSAALTAVLAPAVRWWITPRTAPTE